MKRRMFVGNALGALALLRSEAPRAADPAAALQGSEPLVWPTLPRLRPGSRSFAGHTNTVLDVVGRIGTPPGLVIFTEGNHLMALLSEEIVGPFPTWAKAQPQYADLESIVRSAWDWRRAHPNGYGSRS